MPIHDIWQLFSNGIWLGFKKVIETIFIEKHVFSTKDPKGMYIYQKNHRQLDKFWPALRQEISVAWNFCDFTVESWNPRNLAAKLKCHKIKFTDQNTKLRCHKKTLYKIICENNVPQKYIFPLKLTNYKHFSETDFIFWMKGKLYLENCNNPN